MVRCECVGGDIWPCSDRLLAIKVLLKGKALVSRGF
jgi:hypothetical protein